MQARQRLHRDALGARDVDDLAAQLARRGRHRDQHLVRAVLAQDPHQLVGRAEHADAVDLDLLLLRVVVDEADRRVRERAVALDLADEQLPGVAGAHDQHLFAVRDEARLRPLEQRAREQARAGDEREQEQEVDRRDAVRQPRGVLGRERVEHEVGDAASRS